MSYERGLAAINLRMSDKVPHTEYLSNRQYIQAKVGLDIDNPQEAGEASQAIAKFLDFDFIWMTLGYNWGLPSSWMGRARYSETEELRPAEYAFADVEDVLSFDALESATNLPTQAELNAFIKTQWEGLRDAYPFAVVPGGFYETVFTWHIRTFGWDLFMEAAMADMERFDRVMESFFRITLMMVDAHIAAGIPWYLCHDDIVWASGTVFRPEWMRQYVFPRYKIMFDKLKAAGIKVLFCSDGNFDEYVDDIAAAGAEGFIMEPLTDMAYICERYGQSHVIVGNADCRVLMRNRPEEIRAEVARCMDIGKPCPGYFMAVGNHIPYNIAIEAVDCYLEAYEEMARR